MAIILKKTKKRGRVSITVEAALEEKVEWEALLFGR
jgi:hypothetical protein